MVLSFCHGPTIARCRQVNTVSKAIIDAEPSRKRATFGQLPQDVMTEIIEQCLLAKHRYLRRSTWVLPGATFFSRAETFASLNTTFRKLLQTHPLLTPHLFRGGKVLRPAEILQLRLGTSEFQVHPILH
jgi:hypothetical protein